MKFKHPQIFLAGMAVVMLAAPVAAQDDYPNRPVTIVVPFAAGGMGTNVGNQLAENLAGQLGQSFIIEPRPGAGGAIGFQHVAGARPDGYTLLLGTISTATILPALRSDLPFDTVEDFEPIGHVVSGSNIIVVPSSSPIESMEDLIIAAQDTAANMTCGSSGLGSTLHLSCVLLNSDQGTSLTHVAYTGVAPALIGLVGGEISMMIATTDAIPFIEDGSLRALAVTAPERIAALPDIPTAEELGYSELTIDNWYGLFAPAGTPDEIVGKLSDTLTTIGTSERWEQGIGRLQMSPAANSDSEWFAELITSELARWKPIVEASGATIE